MTIDEAIERERRLAKEIYVEAMLCHANPDDGKLDDCIERGKYHEHLAEWLEELKTIKGDGFTDDLLNMGFTKGYNKALDDFVKFANTMPTVESEDGTIRPMWLEEIAEQLKAGGSLEKEIRRKTVSEFVEKLNEELSAKSERLHFDGHTVDMLTLDNALDAVSVAANCGGV